MKIVFLNCWHGRLLEPLAHYIESQKASTDVFCLQEADPQLQTTLDPVLKLFTKHSADKNIQKPADSSIHTMSQTTYVKQGIEVLASIPLLKDILDTGFGLYTHLSVGTKSVHVLNVHGSPWPAKLDTPSRLEQSKAFIECLKGKEGVRIIGGDLNVDLETQSVRMITDSGYQNLIEEYAIATTRNHYAWDLHPTKLIYSDYVFVDHNTTVQAFTVPDIEISDHLPMVVEILL